MLPPTAPATEAATTEAAGTAASDTTAGSAAQGVGAVEVPMALDPGGPYSAKAGEKITLRASFSTKGQAKSIDDLQTIGAALQAYEAANGSYPPAALSDASGRPLLSWRVLLLPYLGDDAKELYARFDLTSPWDSEINRPLLDEMPAVYRRDAEGTSTLTAYVGVAGPKQLFQKASPSLGGGVKRAEVKDGETMTTAVGPTGDNVAIAWSAPGDLATTDTPRLGTPDGFDGGGGVVTPMLFLDGSVHTVLDTTTADIVHSWSTLAGGGCNAPESHSADGIPSWDVTGDGSFSASGAVVTMVAPAAGTHPLAFRVIDNLGNIHVADASLTVQ